jgi:hypothetical protein
MKSPYICLWEILPAKHGDLVNGSGNTIDSAHILGMTLLILHISRGMLSPTNLTGCHDSKAEANQPKQKIRHIIQHMVNLL